MTKYDDVDWHFDSASEAGHEENAFAHIGLYLGWLIRRDLHNPEMFTDDEVVGVKAGSNSGSDLADNADGKLVSALMTSDGDAFSAWYYDRYLSDFEEAFGGADDYSIADDDANRATIENVLDRRLEEWNTGCRPKPEPAASPPEMPDLSRVAITIGGIDLMDELDDEQRAHMEAMLAHAHEQGWQILEPPPPPHEAPELEALIPSDLAPKLELSSRTGSQWRSSRLNRVLKAVGVRGTEAMVVVGMGGRGDQGVTAAIYGIPGRPAEALADHVSALTKQPGMKCETRVVAGRTVLWCVRPEFILAGWARDEMIVVVGVSDDATLERVVSRLP